MAKEQRRAADRLPTTIDEAKFTTQKTVTFILLLIFSLVAGWVLYGNDQSERSMVLQTVINLTLLAVGYWLGASKAAADSSDTIGNIAKSAAPSQERAVAAARAPAPDEAIVPPATGAPASTNGATKLADAKIDVAGDVTIEGKPKGETP